MNESKAILEAAKRCWARGEVPLLATVVAARGSSYRKPGACMLVSTDGWLAGSVSGGCLEADVVRRASWIVSSDTSLVRTYDTSADGEVALGCGGEVDLLLEPFPSSHVFASALARVLEERIPIECQRALPEGGLFLHLLRPSPRLILAGAGHDALPVCTFATTLGWDTHVVDWRPANLAPHRFPRCQTHLLSSLSLDHLPLEAGCAVVVMSHHLVYDAKVLEAALASDLPKYIGVLGPRKRTKELLRLLPPALPVARLRAPVGLDLGGEGPASVALAIVAQVHAELLGASGHPLG